MQRLNPIKKLFAALVLLSILWFLFFFTELFCEQQKNDNNLFVPQNSTFAVRIDGRSIAEKTFFSVFLEARDEKLLRKIRNSFEELKEKEVKFSGINFLSDMILFSVPYKNGNLIGISLNLTAPSKFKKNYPNIFGKDQFIDVHENVGLILSYNPENKKNTINKKELLAFFHKQIPARNQFVLDRKDKKTVQMYSKGSVFGNSTYFTSSNLFFETHKSSVNIEGSLEISRKKMPDNQLEKHFLQAKKGDFHFSTSIISNSIQDSLEKILSKMGLDLPKIKSISFNYRGMNILNNETGMHTIPNIDLVLEFKQAITAKSILNDPELLNKIEGKFSNNQLKIGNHTYYIQQINKHTIFIGDSEAPVFSDNSEIIAVKGNLSSILKIEGGGIITSFLEIVPIYRASKELFDNTEDFEIIIKKADDQKAQIKGTISFKKDHYAMNEFLKFLLEGKASFD